MAGAAGEIKGEEVAVEPGVRGMRREATREPEVSPFPLLVMALVIAVLLLVRLRAEEGVQMGSVMRAGLPEMAR